MRYFTNNKNYFIKTFLLALIASPLIFNMAAFLFYLTVTFVTFPFAGVIRHQTLVYYIQSGLVVVLSVTTVIAMWNKYVKATQLPTGFIKRYLPLIAAYCYYLLLWIITFGISNYHYTKAIWSTFSFLAIPYFLVVFLSAIGGNFDIFPYVHVILFLVIISAFSFSAQKTCGKQLNDKKGMRAIILLCLVLVCIPVYQQFDRNTKILLHDNVLRVNAEIDPYDYHPFRSHSKLQIPPEKPDIVFRADYPKIDGATAVYPLYATLVEAVYDGLDEKTVTQYVQCNRTPSAYERLINGEIDIFIGTQPSKQQIEQAKRKGVEFKLTPFLKDAFVFFVNKENPVNNLTIEQIQDIYTKKVTNWREVGGNNEKIMPFQRPENSGSQTIMLAKVMNGKKPADPLWEEYAAGMGGIVSGVAAYRNYAAAIGYSFRFFVSDMKRSEDIKLLTIDNIEPSVENIRQGLYPITIDAYAVTVGSESENTQRLIKWLVSEQGWRFIEQCGYIAR